MTQRWVGSIAWGKYRLTSQEWLSLPLHRLSLLQAPHPVCRDHLSLLHDDLHAALRLHLIGPVVHQALWIDRILGGYVR